MTAEEKKYIDDAYRKEHRKLLGWIEKRVSNSFEAEDILQDVFYQLSVGFKDIRAIKSLTSWIYRVAENKIIDRYRKKEPEKFPLEIQEDENDPLNLVEILPSVQDKPEYNELMELVWKNIQSGLDELPENQSEVFILNEFEDKSFQEISEMTGLNINTLISRKRYAVIYLREKLKPLYNLLNS